MKLQPYPNGTPHLTAEQSKRYAEMCEEMATRKPWDRKRIFEAFFGKGPMVKRGRGQRKNRRS